MLIIGTGGFGKDILINMLDNGNVFQLYARQIEESSEVINFDYTQIKDDIVLFDDKNTFLQPFLYEKFNVLSTYEEVKNRFQNINNKFICAIGNPRLRHRMRTKFELLGGQLCSMISPHSFISTTSTISLGVITFPGVGISNESNVGECSTILTNSVIGHGVEIGNYVSISPSCTILANVSIGDFTFIGAGTIILNDIKIGMNVIIPAGSVVTRDIADFETFVNKNH